MHISKYNLLHVSHSPQLQMICQSNSAVWLAKWCFVPLLLFVFFFWSIVEFYFFRPLFFLRSHTSYTFLCFIHLLALQLNCLKQCLLSYQIQLFHCNLFLGERHWIQSSVNTEAPNYFCMRLVTIDIEHEFSSIWCDSGSYSEKKFF